MMPFTNSIGRSSFDARFDCVAASASSIYDRQLGSLADYCGKSCADLCVL